jgi:hypothetical protein
MPYTFCLFLCLFVCFSFSLSYILDNASFVPGGRRMWDIIFDDGTGNPDVAAVMCFSYALLKFIWLKFLLIWRFARLGALADGMDCHENMGKCMSNHRSVQGFWRYEIYMMMVGCKL